MLRMLGVLGVMFCVGLGACAEQGVVPRGKGITIVQREYGLPDVISDSSGDMERSYVPHHRPEYEWPAEAPRTFYYLERNLAVTFVLGKAVSSEPISDEKRASLQAFLEHVREYLATQPAK